MPELPSEYQPIEVDLDPSSLTCECHKWPLPKSAVEVPLITFSGVIGSGASCDEDYRFIRFRVSEMMDIPDYGHGAIIDLRQVVFPEVVSGALIPARLRNENEPFMLVVDPDMTDRVLATCNPEEITPNYDTAITNVAWRLREYRHDGGGNQTSPPARTKAQLAPMTLHISGIDFQCYSLQLAPGSSIAYVRFSGTYRHGSAGADDADYISWRLEQACEVLEPDGLIVNLCKLTYEWGDDLDLYPSCFPDPENNIRFIVSPEQKTAFAYHVFDENCFSDNDSALCNLVDKLR